MKPQEYLSEEELDMIHTSMQVQIDELKKDLGSKKHFKQKEEWKKLSFITEGGDDD